jgi:hypothetical protein
MRRAGKDPRAATMWQAYISFLEACPSLPEHTPGTAVHHILWRSEYPKYLKSPWNLIRLRHEDHTAAAGLALAAEPNNDNLFSGYWATYKLRGGSKRWKPKNSKELIRLYVVERWSPERLGKKFGVAACVVLRYLKRNGVTTRSNGEARRWVPTAAAGRKVMQRYLNGEAPSSIAKSVGVSATGVRRFLLFQGVTLRTRGKSQEIRRTPVESVVSEIITLYIKGWSLRRVAKNLGVSYERVRITLRRNGIKVRSLEDAWTWRARQRGQRRRDAEYVYVSSHMPTR